MTIETMMRMQKQVLFLKCLIIFVKNYQEQTVGRKKLSEWVLQLKYVCGACLLIIKKKYFILFLFTILSSEEVLLGLAYYAWALKSNVAPQIYFMFGPYGVNIIYRKKNLSTEFWCFTGDIESTKSNTPLVNIINIYIVCYKS